MPNTEAIPGELDKDLKQLARSRRTENYKEVAIRCNISPHEMRLSYLVKLLTAVNEREHAEGRPLLAAVVVNKRSKMPGPGFFTFPRDKKFIRGTESEYWKAELERVFDYWARHD